MFKLDIFNRIKAKWFKIITIKKYKYVSSKARLSYDARVYEKDNLIMDDYTKLDFGAVIMNPKAKFIMGKHSGAAFGLSVITGTHPIKVDRFFGTCTPEEQAEIDAMHKLDNDVILAEEVWLGTNVTLLQGVHVGRCATVGAGSVVRTDVPPYALVVGNPAKVVGFKFTNVDEILEHEQLYPENERISEDEIRNNYKKFFIDRLKEIRQITTI